jgi:hypothetical protein
MNVQNHYDKEMGFDNEADKNVLKCYADEEKMVG